MQEIPVILGNAYSTFSHFAIDREVFDQWQKKLTVPIEPHSILLDVLPTSLGLERTLNILLLSTLLSNDRSTSESLPILYKTVKELSTAVLNGVNITDKDVVQQLDRDDILALFTLYNTPEQYPIIQEALAEYLHFLKSYGSLLNVLNRHHGQVFDMLGTLVRTLPSLNERLPVNEMDIPFHTKAFGLVVPLLNVLEREGNIQPHTEQFPTYIEPQSLQMLYSSGLFGPTSASLVIAKGSPEHAELLACGLLSISQLSENLSLSPINIHRSLHTLHSQMLFHSALSLATINIRVQQ